jgi:carbonic anhydrase/acetyltransferase-like protein (isoleucine patch superfamily)
VRQISAKTGQYGMAIRAYRGVTPTLGAGAWVDASAVVIGDVHLGENASVWPLVLIRGDVNHIRIGARSNIQDGSIVHVSRPYPGNDAGWPTILGDDVVIGHKVALHGCTIADRVLVGIGAIVLDGVHVPSDVIIGAGSVVTPGKQLESGFLYVGNPARRSRELRPDEIARIPKMARDYVLLKDEYSKPTPAA